MRYLIAAAVGAAMFAGAAQAAVYQYDVTMELTSYNLAQVYDSGSGEIPQWASEDDCYFGPEGFYDCQVGRLDVMNNLPTGRVLDQITPVANVSILLDSDFGSSTAATPTCEGTPLLCWGINNVRYYRYSATAEEFDFTANGASFNFHISSEGFGYGDDGYFTGRIGADDFTAMDGISVSYRTTDLMITEIAPIPLPASLPLLGVGVAAIGFAKRRRKATRAA